MHRPTTHLRENNKRQSTNTHLRHDSMRTPDQRIPFGDFHCWNLPRGQVSQLLKWIVKVEYAAGEAQVWEVRCGAGRMMTGKIVPLLWRIPDNIQRSVGARRRDRDPGNRSTELSITFRSGRGETGGDMDHRRHPVSLRDTGKRFRRQSQNRWNVEFCKVVLYILLHNSRQPWPGSDQYLIIGYLKKICWLTCLLRRDPMCNALG